MNTTESIPQVWDDQRDGQFFRITAALYTPSYCYGASVLLASYDQDDTFTGTADSPALVTTTQPTTPAAETSEHLGSSHHTAC